MIGRIILSALFMLNDDDVRKTIFPIRRSKRAHIPIAQPNRFANELEYERHRHSQRARTR